jgi:hypothetical protein
MSTSDRFLLSGVMGWPVMHSRSPQIHDYWLAEFGLAGTYVPLAIAPQALRARAAFGEIDLDGVAIIDDGVGALAPGDSQRREPRLDGCADVERRLVAAGRARSSSKATGRCAFHSD